MKTRRGFDWLSEGPIGLTAGRWLLMMVAPVPLPATASTGTFTVTETWSVRLEYKRFGRDQFTGTRTFTGTQTGTIRVVDGSYQILDRTGIGWSSPGRDLRSRSLFGTCINVSYPFAHPSPTRTLSPLPAASHLPFRKSPPIRLCARVIISRALRYFT